MKYDLASLAKNKGARKYALFPRMDTPIRAELAYLKLLRQIISTATEAIREVVIPSIERTKLITTDDESVWEQLSRLVNGVGRLVNEQYKDLLKLEGQKHTDEWMRKAKSAFGIDLSAVVREEDIADYLDQAAQRNAALIKNLGDDLVKRVQYETTQNIINGSSVKALKETLKETLGITDRRAQLIAVDQSSKLTADLNRIRHKQAGIDEYIWRTSLDERVRPRHRALEGNQYKYDEPTGAEDGLPPGQPIRCRCTAQGIVSFEADSKPVVPKEPPLTSINPDPEVNGWVKTATDNIPVGSIIYKAFRKHLKTLGSMEELSEATAKTAYYNPPTRRIQMYHHLKDDWRGNEIFRHEFGHHVDGYGFANPWVSKRAVPVMREESKSIPKFHNEERRQRATFNSKLQTETALKKAFKDEGIDFDLAEWMKSHPTMSRSINKEAHIERAQQILYAIKSKDPQWLLNAYPDDHVLADFIGALSDNARGYGHSRAYYTKMGSPPKEVGEGHAIEAFANYFAIAGAPDSIRLAVLKRMFPKTTKEFEEIIVNAGRD